MRVEIYHYSIEPLSPLPDKVEVLSTATDNVRDDTVEQEDGS
jgi:hypothetical protein